MPLGAGQNMTKLVDLVQAMLGTAAMTKMVNVHEAKTHLSKLLERAHAGEEIILAKGGKPYAKLVPLHSERQPGLVEGRITDEFFEPLPPEELEAWGQ